MSKVHMKLDGTWAPCHATRRACPRQFHVQGFTAQQVQELPKDMLRLLIDAMDPPTWQDAYGNMRWEDAKGRVHRDHDLPAVDYRGDGLQAWYQHGEQHRGGDKPAVIDSYGNKSWFWRDELHREDDKPAEEYATGLKAWWHHGERHRSGGKPAVVEEDGSVGYWEEGSPIYPPEEQA